ncbi:MAG: endo-1,4-beta-xylanase [Lachnospiraceae bacterium]|nr:endo-1,4-beta-xylanase [uncultured Acetatifactor sp.]MCI8286448.1 endo-1,4-beta-xylanase [Lachnospiraceae bacterium]
MSLRESYQSYFKMGAAIPGRIFKEEATLAHIVQEYDSITCENDMKPMFLLDEARNCAQPEKYDRCPAVKFDTIERYMDFAREKGLGVRGHTLVWHNQTPRWFFAQGYSKEEDAPLTDRDTMLARLENYIRGVLEAIQKRWPGVIYVWDVVNEAIDNGGLRESLWTKTVGEDFIIQAFRFARKYADPNVKLFYNDYDTFVPWKRDVICESILKPLLEEGLVDGMGMQAHLTMETDLGEFENSMKCFGALPLQVQITELDIHNADPSEASMDALAERYEQLFRLFLDNKKEGKANVTGVTFWGLHDDITWLTFFRREKSYPLLFDGNLQPKKAYAAVVHAAEEAAAQK